jgi:hypothetical protein
LQRVTVARGDDGPLVVQGELAVAGIGGAAIGQLDFEVAAAADHQVKGVVRGLDVALTVVFLGGDHLGPAPIRPEGSSVSAEERPPGWLMF